MRSLCGDLSPGIGSCCQELRGERVVTHKSWFGKNVVRMVTEHSMYDHGLIMPRIRPRECREWALAGVLYVCVSI
jgi:hypothetical protein